MACRYADDASEQSGEAGTEVPQRRSQGADLAALLNDSLGEARSFRYRCAVLAGQLLPAKPMTSSLQTHSAVSLQCAALGRGVLCWQISCYRPGHHQPAMPLQLACCRVSFLEPYFGSLKFCCKCPPMCRVPIEDDWQLPPSDAGLEADQVRLPSAQVWATGCVDSQTLAPSQHPSTLVVVWQP